jgi:ComF family protein
MLDILGRHVLDWVFAPACAACGAPTPEPLCAPCRDTLEPIELRAGDAIASPWRFGGQLAVAIRRLKHARRTCNARTLAPLWAPVIAAAAGGDALVVPVPSHWRRRFARGFDHAWLLALHACRAAGLRRPVPALRKLRATPPQSTLPAATRHTNLRGAFAVRRPSKISGRAIVLVDDVATTGATLAECARTLREAGAASVVGVALSRATSDP